MTILARRKVCEHTITEYSPKPSKSQSYEELIASNQKSDTQESH